MSVRRDDTSAIARRYGPAAAAEWRRVTSHFALNEGFALLVLIVPDRDGAGLCRSALANRLRGSGQGVLDVSPTNPSALRQLAPTLLALRPPPDRAAVWLAAAVPGSADDHAAWQMAWRWGLATLNQNRNRLRQQLDRSLVVVGVPALVPLFREAAPDLWSVRSLVAHIRPEPNRIMMGPIGLGRPALPRWPRAMPVPNLHQALAEIERLRDAPGCEIALAAAVERAAGAYACRGDLPAAEACFREALDLRDRFDTAPGIARTLLRLGDVLLDQGRGEEAQGVLRRALTLVSRDDTRLRMTAMDLLAYALLAQGEPVEAETLFRQALALADQNGVASVARGVMTDMLARSILAQGRPVQAEAVFRRAVGLIEAGGGDPVSRGVTLEMLAHAVLAQGRAAEAATMLRRALTLAEEGGAGPVSRAVTTRTLAQAVLARGRRTEARALLLGALELARNGGAPDDLIRIMGAD